MSTAAPSDRDRSSCDDQPGRLVPVVNLGRCEAKADCVAVCPFGVFEVRRIDDADFAALSWLGKLRSVVHGRKAAYTPKADACHACGLCVPACPEKAIKLRRAPEQGA